MKAMMKVTIRLSVLALIISAGCITKELPDGTRTTRNWVNNLHEWASSINRNEVAHSFDRTHGWGMSVSCFEQMGASTDNALKTSDVYVNSEPFILQMYRIEGRKVFNCRWITNFDDQHDFTTDEERWTDNEAYHTFCYKRRAMWETLNKLPNKLGEIDASESLLGEASTVVVTSMNWVYEIPPPPELGCVMWGVWGVRQWTRMPSELLLAEVEAFCQSITQVLSAPKYLKKYRSYLRAVPLLTQEALEAEKDTPLIDLKKSPYYVRRATTIPYVLFPVSGSGSPFPAVRGYKPGDKFKVRNEFEDEPCYFLIETFARGK